MTKSKDSQSSNPPPDTGDKQPFEAFTGDLLPWELAALKATMRWPEGFAVTQSEFDDALRVTRDEVIR